MSLRIDGRMAGLEVGARYKFHLRDGVDLDGELIRFYIDAAGHPTTLKVEATGVRPYPTPFGEPRTVAIPWLSVTYAERLEV